MRSHYVAFTSPNQAELFDEDISADGLGAHEGLIRAEYSIISSGTEGAGFTDLVREMPGYSPSALEYPRRTGYGHLGELIAVGPGVGNAKVGDRILTFSRHASVAVGNVERFALQVTRSVPGKRAVATRMAGVSITALRSSSVKAGDRVVVIGLGLVGNFAAQLFQLAGARVLALDVSSKRLDIARKCGIRDVHDSSASDPVAAAREWSGDGKGAEVVVEAIGRSELVMQGVEMARDHGEVILLGSPRARVTADVTPMLTRIHMQAIRMIGALEWTFAMEAIEENYKRIIKWIADERLIVDPLISHVISPRDCQQAYDGLTHKKDEYTAVVFDWSSL